MGSTIISFGSGSWKPSNYVTYTDPWSQIIEDPTGFETPKKRGEILEGYLPLGGQVLADHGDGILLVAAHAVQQDEEGLAPDPALLRAQRQLKSELIDQEAGGFTTLLKMVG